MMSSCWQRNDAAADMLSNSSSEGAGLAGPLFWCLLGAHLCQTLQQAAFSWGRCTPYEQSEILRIELGCTLSFPCLWNSVTYSLDDKVAEATQSELTWCRLH